MNVEIDQDIMKDIIAAITEKRNSLVIDNLWKQVPKYSGFTGFTGSAADHIDTDPIISQTELDIKLKKFDNLINQLKANSDFT
jgi:hypothetical protein